MSALLAAAKAAASRCGSGAAMRALRARSSLSLDLMMRARVSMM